MTSPSPLERLVGPGNVLGKEAPDAKEFAGLVRSGMDKNDKDSKLANLYKNAEQDLIILDENKEPSLVTSLSLVLAGLALVGATVLIRRRNQDSAASDVI